MGPTVRASMRLTLRSDGTLEVEGPLDDRAACYAMLELARDVVREHKPQLVQPVSAIPNRG